MTVVRLRVSKVMLMLNSMVHFLAIAAVGLSNITSLYSNLLIALVLLSLLLQWRIICMWRPDSIIALELLGEECQPVFRDSHFQQRSAPLQLSDRSYSSPLLQVVYFIPKKTDNIAGANPGNRVRYFLQSRIGLRSLCILRDSCADEDWRQLRKFLRWRVCF